MLSTSLSTEERTSSESPCPTCCNKRNRNGEQSELSATPFRLVEKKYKLYELSRRDARRKPPLPETDMSDVIDFQHVENNSETNRKMIHKVHLDSPAEAPSSTPPLCYTFEGVPGLLVFPGILSDEEQVEWCREAVLEFGDSAQHPNILSTHAKKQEETTCYQPPMRWATLGFSYEWTSKTYNRAKYSCFPQGLRRRMCDLVRMVAQVRQDEFRCAYPDTYEPQTAIVNYYPVGSMMMCHQDISEETLEQPLMSLSLGCSAIFLMGTQSRDEAPHAFLLRSGDLAAFTGPSRTAFHSTPRILDDCPLSLTLPEGDMTAEERERYVQHAYYAARNTDLSFLQVRKDTMSAEEKERYWRLCMRHMRVNINARQVYNEYCAELFK